VVDAPVALVTGAASGIGRATAQRLAARGDRVALLDLDERGLAETAALIQANGGAAEAACVDVRDGAAVGRAVGQVVGRWGRVDYLFSNAGVTCRKPVADLTVDDWRFVFETNVHGAFHVCRAVLPGMVQRGRGAIVFTSSDYAVIGMRGQANYAAAKTALYALTKSLALEFAASGIRVNAVGPGPIDTPQHHQGRTRAEWDAWLRGRLDRIPMGRLGTPEEVASVVDFLLSDRAGYVSGQLVQPNGGQVMW
jgi:NAD(P)-dependent dehydrogenase (short-subunit alcohol dehydrogenase family)